MGAEIYPSIAVPPIIVATIGDNIAKLREGLTHEGFSRLSMASRLQSRPGKEKAAEAALLDFNPKVIQQ